MNLLCFSAIFNFIVGILALAQRFTDCDNDPENARPFLKMARKSLYVHIFLCVVAFWFTPFNVILASFFINFCGFAFSRWCVSQTEWCQQEFKRMLGDTEKTD